MLTHLGLCANTPVSLAIYLNSCNPIIYYILPKGVLSQNGTKQVAWGRDLRGLGHLSITCLILWNNCSKGLPIKDLFIEYFYIIYLYMVYRVVFGNDREIYSLGNSNWSVKIICTVYCKWIYMCIGNWYVYCQICLLWIEMWIVQILVLSINP